MNTQIWAKYLPIIKILMKRSAGGDQVLNLNLTDFERAGMARKSGYKFTIQFSNGRVDNVISAIPLAKDLATALLEDAAVKELLLQNDYHISLNPKYQLGIKFIPRPDAGDGTSSTPVQADAGNVS
ncbi:MAG TPA: hypothetical protein VGE66_04490 [Chitinophagaceae bacterium]